MPSHPCIGKHAVRELRAVCLTAARIHLNRCTRCTISDVPDLASAAILHIVQYSPVLLCVLNDVGKKYAFSMAAQAMCRQCMRRRREDLTHTEYMEWLVERINREHDSRNRAWLMIRALSELKVKEDLNHVEIAIITMLENAHDFYEWSCLVDSVYEKMKRRKRRRRLARSPTVGAVAQYLRTSPHKVRNAARRLRRLVDLERR